LIGFALNDAVAQRRQHAQNIDARAKPENRLIVLCAEIDIKIDLHSAADFIVRARCLSFDAGKLFALQHFDRCGKLNFKWPDFFGHRRRVTLARFDRLGIFTARHARDETIHIPDKFPNLFPRRENFYLFLKLQWRPP